MELLSVMLLPFTMMLSFGCSYYFFPKLILFANNKKLVDIPTSRRRHPRPMPIIGGLSIFIFWTFGLTVYSLVNPLWYFSHYRSLWVIFTAVLILMIMGLIDDLKGVKPVGKLFWQFTAAVFVLMLEPRIHSVCLYWSDKIGFLIWPLAVLWMSGLSNAINLIDGLDGLAGGTSLLVTISLSILCVVWGIHAEFSFVSMLLLIPPLAAFLKYNWNPAEIFLGDNGSLPLGFLIGVISLMCPPTKSSWILFTGIIFMMGYPIIDMGLCVLRRYKKNTPLFKADRNHLHYRLLRLGFSIPQTSLLLLGISICLQCIALALNLISSSAALLVILGVSVSLINLLYTIRVIEKWRIDRVSRQTKYLPVIYDNQPKYKECMVSHIELDTLFEAGLLEEQERLDKIISSLELMLKSSLRKEDIIYRSERKLSIVFVSTEYNSDIARNLINSLREKLAMFQKVFDLQYSLSSLPINIEKHRFMIVKDKIHFSELVA